MPLSTISKIVEEGQALQLATFLRTGVLYTLWASQSTSGRQIQWKPHTAADYTEVIGSLYAAYSNVAAIVRPDGTLLVVWDDDGGLFIGGTPKLYSVVFNLNTGAVVSPQKFIGYGTKPSLLYRGGVAGNDMLLGYCDRRTGGIYLRETLDGGLTWGEQRPILTNQVRDSEDVVIAAHDRDHVAVVQLGGSARPMNEIGAYSRTRPISIISRHPIQTNLVAVCEASNYISGTPTLSDNARGGIGWSADGTKLYQLVGTRQGTDDGVGVVALLDISGNTPTLNSSATVVTSGPPGDNLDVYNAGPPVTATTTSTDLPGSQYTTVGIACSATYAYIPGYADSTTSSGGFVVYKLSDATYAPVWTADSTVTYGRAVSVANTTTPVIAAAVTDSGVEKVRFYTENGLTPTLVSSHAIPARATRLQLILDDAGKGTLFVAMASRLNVYAINGLTQPIRLMESFQVPTNGTFYTVQKASNGNLFCAAGYAGVLALTPQGRILSQTLPSGVVAPPWKPTTVYAVGALVRPTQTNAMWPRQIYYKATTAGTSASMEPAWADTGTIIDPQSSGVVWTPQGSIRPYVTDLVLDEVRKRVYAVGLLGGPKGTAGRMWMFSAKGLL